MLKASIMNLLLIVIFFKFHAHVCKKCLTPQLNPLQMRTMTMTQNVEDQLKMSSSSYGQDRHKSSTEVEL